VIAMRALLCIACLLATPSPAPAQTTGDFTAWVYQRLAIALGRPIEAAADKQVETPSIADGSMTLVDGSTAPDIVGLAMQFFNVATADGAEPVSLTVSAFAIRTAFRGEDPMRPQVYAAGRRWRRVSVTVGRAPAGADGRLSESQIFGAKALLWDGRDLASPANVALLQSIDTGANAQSVAQASRALQDLLFQRLGPRMNVTDIAVFTVEHLSQDAHAKTLALLTEDDLDAVDELLRTRLAPLLDDVSASQARLIRRVSRQPQLSLSYQATLRRADGDDEHAVVGILDVGASEHFSLTVNGAFTRVARTVLPSEHDVTVAAELDVRFRAGPRSLLELQRPRPAMTLSGSFAATRHSSRPSTRKGQVKLNVPIALGLSLPISITVANRSALIDERDVRGQVGLTVDFAALTRAFRSNVR
jgi:hypothetical protein